MTCAKLGWRVVPAHAREKRPGLKDWPAAATTDEGQIGEWWTGAFTGRAVCLATGRESNAWVLDIDVKQYDGEAALQALCAEWGELPETFEVRTPSGGRHLYFSYPETGEVKNTVNGIGLGIDTRGWHGQAMAPGTSINGGVYRVTNPVLPFAAAPAWLLSLVEKSSSAGQLAGDWEEGDVVGVDELVAEYLEKGLPAGAHDVALTVVAAKLAARGVGDAQALETLRSLIDATKIDESRGGWSDENLLQKVHSAREKFPPPEPLDPSLVAWATGALPVDQVPSQSVVPPSPEVVKMETEAVGGTLRSTRGEPPASPANADNFGNPAVPVESAGAVLKRLFRWTDGEKRFSGLKHWRQEWRSYTGTHWALVSEDAMKAVLYRFFADATYLVPKDGEGGKVEFEAQAWNPNRGKIGDVLGALAGLTEEPEATEMPSWTREDETGVTVPCSNGLLRVAGGERKLVRHSVDYFCGYSLPFAYDPSAGCERWLKFLGEVFPGDPESAALLQEWFGYVVSGRLDLQKMMMFVGASRSGKSTIAKVLSRLLGPGNVASPMLGSFSTNFGLSSLLGKPLAIVDDARYSSKLDVQAVTERLLTIVGGSALDVDRKNKSIWAGVLPSRLMILSNELPNFKDSSEAIINRMVVLHFRESFLGREDLRLVEKLELELAGILNWALDGLKWLEETGGKFTTAREAGALVSELRESVNPLGTFLAERCVVGADEWCVVSDFVAELVMWEGKSVEVTQSLEMAVGKRLRAAVPKVEKKRKTVPGRGRPNCYLGVGLRESSVVAWARQVTGESAGESPE